MRHETREVGYVVDLIKWMLVFLAFAVFVGWPFMLDNGHVVWWEWPIAVLWWLMLIAGFFMWQIVKRDER
jgi:hypothetical protein